MGGAHAHYFPPVVVAVLSDRLKWRGPFILICLPFAIARLSTPTTPLIHSDFGQAGYILAIAATTNAQR